MIFNNIKFRKKDLYFLSALLFVYALITVIITFVTGDPIYPIFDFKTNMTYVYAVAVVFIMLLGFSIGYLISQFK